MSSWHSRFTPIVCDHPRDGHLCPDCAGDLRDLLTDIPELTRQLRITLTKDTHFSPTSGTKEADPDEAAVDFNVGASRALSQLTAFLGGQPAQVAEWWLATFNDRLLQPAVTDFAAQLSEMARRAYIVIDRPRDTVYLGQCAQCSHALRADRDARYVGCPRCGADHDVDVLKADAMRAGEDRWLTEAELLIAFDGLTKTLLRQWYRHEGLPTTELSRPYWSGGALTHRHYRAHRLADVRDKLAEHSTRLDCEDNLTTDQVAESLGCTANAVRLMVGRGELEPVVRGIRPLVFSRRAVNALATARTRT